MNKDINSLSGTAAVLWDLSALYAGPDDPKIARHKNDCLQMAEHIAAKACDTVAQLDAKALCALLKELEALDTLSARLESYAFLYFITQTGNAAASALLQQMEELAAQVGRLTVFFRLEWNRLPEEKVVTLLQQPELATYQHYLQVLRLSAPHQLGRSEEELLQELKPVGRSAWNLLFDKIFGQLRFGPENRSEEEVLSDLYHPEREKRIQAAQEMTEGLQGEIHILSHIFNTLAAEKMIDDRLRHYPSWISSMNLANELEDRTVTQLVEAVSSRYAIVHRYYRLKKGLLGLDELFDYDRYAPLPDMPEQHISWEQCKDIVLTSFAAFSPQMAEIGERFFRENWIHAPVLPGKRGGAFAHPCVPEAHPYLLVNYTGNLRDVSTVAHELGHGVHQYLAAAQGMYNSDTPLVLAETASVFAELLVFEAQRKLLPEPKAQQAFICQKLESIFATVFRQVAMHCFEAELHQGRRKQGELSPEQISGLWMQTQKPMFGNSLTLREEYGLWWAYISHFLAVPGYVYSYAFGELLVLALYARYLQEGEGFVARYLELMRAGGCRSPYELLAPFQINLNDPAFWHGGLDIIETLLAEAEQN